ncbi:transposase domain-containing protein [Vibrio rotiferianus]
MATIRKRRLPLDMMIWIVLGMAFYRFIAAFLGNPR